MGNEIRTLLMRELHSVSELILTSETHSKSLEWFYQRYKALHECMASLREGDKLQVSSVYYDLLRDLYGDNTLKHSVDIIVHGMYELIAESIDKVPKEQRQVIEGLGVMAGNVTSVTKYFYYKHLPYSLEYIPSFNRCLLKVHNSVEFVDFGLLDHEGLDPKLLVAELEEKIPKVNFIYDEAKFIYGLCSSTTLYSSSMTITDWRNIGIEQIGPKLFANGELVKLGEPETSKNVRAVYDKLIDRGPNICKHRLANQYFDLLLVATSYQNSN